MSRNSQHDNDTNPTQPLPTSTAPPANVTPFDTQLVDDPNAPRHTQPLPSQFAPTPTTVTAPTSIPSQTPTYAPRSLPSQVVPNQAVPNNDPSMTSSTRSANQTPTLQTPTIAPPVPFSAPVNNVPANSVPTNSPTSSLPASRLPLGTIAGLAAIGGALAVVFGSAFFRRLAPVPENARGNSTIVIEKKSAPANSGTIILERPAETSGTEKGVSIEVQDEKLTPRKSAPRIVTAAPVPTIKEPDSENDVSSRDNTSSGDIEYSNSTRDENPTRADEVRSDNSSRNDTDSFNDNSASNNIKSNNVKSDNARSEDAARFIEKRRAYSIQPPREFRLAQKGRRTIWKDQSGAQLLVEVGDNDGETPRAGWEKLDRSLQKKYGSRYRSRGIRNTTLNGRQAAAWEFDLKQKNGVTVRKLDVAVVDGKNGYAILASAPVERFEEMRPTFNRALDSFQIDNGNSSEKLDDASAAENFDEGF